jgi:hypothetical protein
MPEVDWRSSNLALSLIKGSAWSYENEWRYVKKTIRPKMRLIGSFAHQIYNAVHANPNFSVTEHEEWGRINNDLMKRLEAEYNRERVIPIRPSRAYLGLSIEHQYMNAATGETCERMREMCDRLGIPVSRVRARPNSFDLGVVDVGSKLGWMLPQTFLTN